MTSVEDTEIETLSVSKRLIRNISRKFKSKKPKRKELGRYLVEERQNEKPVLKNCISLYIKSGGGCSRVVSCEEIDVNGIRKLNISDDCLPLKGVDKKNSRKMKGLEQWVHEVSLPDDIVEMILVRSSLKTLIVARLVCKKWNEMIVSAEFVRLRLELSGRNPWLFLFGLTRKGVHVGEVFGLDIVEDNWVTIQHDLLKDRFLYSVTNVGTDIYIVGGCSALKTHNGVIVFSPLTNLWRAICPMKVARSEPVLGVFEVSSYCIMFQNRGKRKERSRPKLKTRNLGVSEVYEDPHRFSLRRQLRGAFTESSTSIEAKRKTSKLSLPKYALIVVGGGGSHNEPLDTGEIYDPVTNTWIETARMPEDFGSVSSGAVCSGKFFVYSSISDKLASYDLESGFWVLIQALQPPPCIRAYNPRLVSLRNRLYMCCVCWSERNGQVNSNGEQAVRMLWELDTEINSWTMISTHPDAPMDKNAAFVVNREKIYGLEMFKVFGQALDFLTACHVSDNDIKWSRVSRKHARHEACTFSCSAKSMVALHL